MLFISAMAQILLFSMYLFIKDLVHLFVLRAHSYLTL